MNGLQWFKHFQALLKLIMSDEVGKNGYFIVPATFCNLSSPQLIDQHRRGGGKKNKKLGGVRFELTHGGFSFLNYNCALC